VSNLYNVRTHLINNKPRLTHSHKSTYIRIYVYMYIYIHTHISIYMCVSGHVWRVFKYSLSKSVNDKLCVGGPLYFEP